MLASAFFNGLGHDQHHCRGAHLSHCALTVLQCVKYICLDNEATFTLVGCMDMQIAAEMWRFPDRSTESGKRINMYLSKEVEMSDEEVHLLFAQNRWEKRCACVCVCVLILQILDLAQKALIHVPCRFRLSQGAWGMPVAFLWSQCSGGCL